MAKYESGRYKYTTHAPRTHRLEFGEPNAPGHKIGWTRKRDKLSNSNTYKAKCLCGWSDMVWVPKRILYKRYDACHIQKLGPTLPLEV